MPPLTWALNVVVLPTQPTTWLGLMLTTRGGAVTALWLTTTLVVARQPAALVAVTE